MRQDVPKRFAIIGPPGSGKSTFANKLGKLLDIPVHHLDRHRFEPDGKREVSKNFCRFRRHWWMKDRGLSKGALSLLLK